MSKYGKGGTKFSPTTDAGLGLVYRLNLLWAKADIKCLAGEFDNWNFVLDRIYSSLSYREKMETKEDPNTGEIIDVKQVDPNSKIYNIFTNRIKKAKNEYYNAYKRKDAKAMVEAREKHYQILMKKDIWLKKFMAELGLYLKEYEYNPATALFGGG